MGVEVGGIWRAPDFLPKELSSLQQRTNDEFEPKSTFKETVKDRVKGNWEEIQIHWRSRLNCQPLLGLREPRKKLKEVLLGSEQTSNTDLRK